MSRRPLLACGSYFAAMLLLAALALVRGMPVLTTQATPNWDYRANADHVFTKMRAMQKLDSQKYDPAAEAGSPQNFTHAVIISYDARPGGMASANAFTAAHVAEIAAAERALLAVPQWGAHCARVVAHCGKTNCTTAAAAESRCKAPVSVLNYLRAVSAPTTAPAAVAVSVAEAEPRRREVISSRKRLCVMMSTPPLLCRVRRKLSRGE